jgi:TonB family protein
LPNFIRLWMAALVLVLLAGEARAQGEPPPSGEGAVPRGGAGAVVRPAKPGDQPPPAKPVVTMPKLVHFESAPHPPEALKQGLEGHPVLKLTIDATGKVTAAEVVEPAGHGFDEAAKEAALKFVYEPATRDGKPIPVQILYRYDFTLKTVEKTGPPSPGTPPGTPPPPAPPRRGNLKGMVKIVDANAPLAGAEVFVRAADGTIWRAQTDGEGRWSIVGLPPGRYHVKVVASGFRPTENEEDVVGGEETDVTYGVLVETQGLEVVVVGERPPREVTRRVIERREIDRIPGTGGDALRSIQSMPGVARPPGLAGLLIVRGSAPEDTQSFVDGAGVPLIYHFGGLSSVVPTELLDRIDFYPGNFSVKYGRLMGGIVDVALREPDITCNGPYMVPTERTGCYHGMAQIDLIDMRLMAQGPVPLLDDWSFAVAGRRSWFDVWLKPALEELDAGVTSAPVYYDYQAIVEHKPSPDSRLSLRAFGSDDRFEILIRDPLAQDPALGGNISLGTKFWTLQALYQGELNSSVELTNMLSVSRNAFDFSLGNFLFEIVFYPINYRSEIGWKITKGIKFNAGLDFQFGPYDLVARFPPPPRPGEPDAGPFVTRPPVEQRTSGTVFRPAWYGEFELVPTDRWRVVPGARVDFARDSGHADFSPRVNSRYDLVKGLPGEGPDTAPARLRTTLKGGVGLFTQPPDFGETDAVFGTPGLESNRAIHYSLGVEQEFTRQIELSVEGFYKDLDNLVSRDPESSGDFVYNNEGTGYVIGGEALLKYKPDARFFGWLAYTISRSARTEDGDDRPFEWDQTHNLIVLGSYRLGRGWEFGARFRVVSGRLVTPVLPALPGLYVADAGAYVPLQGEPFSERLPLFHQLDLRLDKRWQFESWRFSAYLDIQNAYNNAAAEDYAYNYNFSKRVVTTGLPIIPSIGIRGEF